MMHGNDENQPDPSVTISEADKNSLMLKRKRKISPHKLETVLEQKKSFSKDEEPIDLKLKEIDNLVRLPDENLLANNPQIKAFFASTQNSQNNNSLNCVLNAPSQKFLNFIALQQQQQTTLAANKNELLNKQLIQNSMNVLMQSIPAPSSDMSNFATVNLAFNALLVHALNFQQCVDRYLQQLQESLAITAYEKHIVACVAAAVNTTNHNLSQSDSSSSPNNSCDLFQKSLHDISAVDLSGQQELKGKKLDLDHHRVGLENKTVLQRPKKTGGRRSGNAILVNGVVVKKSNFRGTSEEENEIDPNFKPIELENGRILLSERYPTVTLPGETLSSLIVKSSASATRLIRLLMKSFFMQDELAASSLSGEGIYKKRLDPNITEAIKCFIRKRHPQLKTGSINLCMTDVCVQARRVSNNQRSRNQTSATQSNHSASSLTNTLVNITPNLNSSGGQENMSSYSPASETSGSFIPTMTIQSGSLGVFPTLKSEERKEDPSESTEEEEETSTKQPTEEDDAPDAKLESQSAYLPQMTQKTGINV